MIDDNLILQAPMPLDDHAGIIVRPGGPRRPDKTEVILLVVFFLITTVILMIAGSLGDQAALAATLPDTGGPDAAEKLQAASTLLHIADLSIFQWGARVFSGLCIMSSAWALKEQRFGMAGLSLAGAILFGTAPKWVKNIFEISGEQGLFTQLELRNYDYRTEVTKAFGSSVVAACTTIKV
ncbi:hypothetical protein WDW86_05030 [Bdellovibrionota bacterium FG-2]